MENSEENRDPEIVRKGVRAVLDTPPQYCPAGVIDEGSLAAATIADPIRAAIRSLIDNLDNEIILPTAAAPTRDEVMRRLGKAWPEYLKTMRALHALLSVTPVGAALVVQAQSGAGDTFRSAAKRISGEHAAEEVRFTEETYASALRMTVRFPVLSAARDLEADRRACRKFNAASAMHTFGLLMIARIGSGKHATPVGLEVAFEFLRAGAIDAYIAARTGLELREPVEDVSDDSLPFDEEDAALACGA